MTAGDHTPLPEGLRFDDGKAPEALRTIGEVARALGLKQHVLRYWEEQFPMLRPLTRAGGRRYYRPEDIALLDRINRLLNHEGYTIRGARQTLEGGKGAPPSAAPAPATPAAPAIPSREEDRMVEALKILRSHLHTIRDRLSEALEA